MHSYLIYALFLVIGSGIAMLVFRSKLKKLGDEFFQFAYVYRQDLLAGKRSINTSQLSAIFKAGEREMNQLAEEILQDSLRQKSAPAPQVVTHELNNRFNNILIINELGQKITSSLLLPETMSHLFSTLNSMMDAAIVELGVFDEERKSWIYYLNNDGKASDDYSNHIAEWSQKNNRKIILEDAGKDYGRYVNTPLVASSGEIVQSIMAFPVLYQEQVVGVLTVGSFRANAFNSYHEDSLEHLLGFLTVALRNAITHEQLNSLKLKAEQSEKHEQQFLANMSHEIRTPMNAILGMTQLLLDTNLDQRQHKYLNAINNSSKNLLVIINDILDLSKLEAGKMEVEKIPFKIKDVIQNIQDTSKFKAQEKGLTFEINISPDLPEVVKGDPTRLNQILTNLISNAIKFTDKGRVIVIADMPANSEFIRFRVIDTGIGISQDQLHLLFSNFKQIDSSTFRKYGGTGLGLSISKTLIELQGGRVHVNSSIGKGSEFSVEIPYEVGDASDVGSSKSDVTDYRALSGVRILVAEDNEYNQIVVNDTLESLIHDVKVDIAENGLIAIELLQKNIYDIILMDAQMPEMDGIETTRVIRKMEQNSKCNIPIIALTASVHKADVDKCLSAGMNDYIPKPFTRVELLGTIAKYYHNNDTNSIFSNEVAIPKSIEIKRQIANITSEDQVTNLQTLHEFTEGNSERMNKYIALYLKLLPDNISKIERALMSQNINELVKLIHTIRPHLNYMGMNVASTQAEELENNIRENQNIDQIEYKTRLILNHCRKSQEELQCHISIQD